MKRLCTIKLHCTLHNYCLPGVYKKLFENCWRVFGNVQECIPSSQLREDNEDCTREASAHMGFSSLSCEWYLFHVLPLKKKKKNTLHCEMENISVLGNDFIRLLKKMTYSSFDFPGTGNFILIWVKLTRECLRVKHCLSQSRYLL